MNKTIEDLQDKLNAALDESDEMRSKAERLEKLNHSQRQSLEEKQRKEDRLIMQYDKLLEQLRSEIKEKERELHAQDWAQHQHDVAHAHHTHDGDPNLHHHRKHSKDEHPPKKRKSSIEQNEQLYKKKVSQGAKDSTSAAAQLEIDANCFIDYSNISASNTIYR